MKDFLLAIVSVVAALAVVLLFIMFGWYIVWVAFLSRFKLMRELLGKNDDAAKSEKDKKKRLPAHGKYTYQHPTATKDKVR